MSESVGPHEELMLEFLSALKFQDLSEEVVSAVEALIFDHLVCALVGLEQPWIQLISDQLLMDMGSFAAEPETPVAAIYGSDESVPARVAAMINAAASHALELDDTYTTGLLHPGCCVLPSAIAATYGGSGDGRDLIAAVVAGYELIGRMCQAIGNTYSDRGFHGTGVIGPTGAALAAVKVLGGKSESVLDAVRISASFGAGIKAFTNGPGMVKHLHAGRAAESGLFASQLALRGYKGPVGALAGRFGLMDVLAYGEKTQPERLSLGLGSDYVVNDMYIKPFATCARIHGAILAALDLSELDNIHPDDIAEIVIGGSADMLNQNSISEPTDPMTAQYSVEYSVALAFLGLVRDLSRYESAVAYSDPAVRGLIMRMRVVVDDEAEANAPACKEARVSVVLKDGGSKVRYGSASAANSSGWDTILTRAKWLLEGRLSPQQQSDLVAAVKGLKDGGSIADCLSVLSPDAPM